MHLKLFCIVAGLLSFTYTKSQSLKDLESLVIGKYIDTSEISLGRWQYTFLEVERIVKTDTILEIYQYVNISPEEFKRSLIVFSLGQIGGKKLPNYGVVFMTFSEKKYQGLWNECLIRKDVQFIKEDYSTKSHDRFYRSSQYNYKFAVVAPKFEEQNTRYILSITPLE